MFYPAKQEGLVDPQHSVQVGIRTGYERDGHGFHVLSADWVNDHGPAATSARIKEIIGERKAYVSFDIDGLDPAFAPGTGTPVVGGMTTNAGLQIIRSLVDIDVVGMDRVEVCPPYDSAEITALAGATLCLGMLYVWADRKRRNLL
jgi:agmatinase